MADGTPGESSRAGSGMRWSPTQYDLFQSHRATPFFDLTSRISSQEPGPRRVVDLGCGPGSLTRTLAERWPDAEVVGVDSSLDMIRQARSQADLPPNLSFVIGDIASWEPGPRDDVVVTNAALQWVPGHQRLLPGWFDALPAGGWFAMQVPGSSTNRSHELLRELAASPRWEPLLRDVIRPEENVSSASAYLTQMLECGLEATSWETTYEHLLQGDDPVLEWVRGTSLRPVLTALGPDDRAEFEASYRALLADAYPTGRFGTIYPFRRIFAVGRKPA
ncbi:methyltransferase domain-containing protein [Frondihabitans australicus]|uniref:Trans-aconitate 2-methyltransferase n=1 Tax=Frondihabitans australicus TaxID=386892 RepID=A0A495ICD9_9MICO|nr:methyltransferase domain-containing protein [Frondihabitans australicus]RKR73602.1 trans-aconitate 2-methyltransferase [Frondihabitans australicus]